MAGRGGSALCGGGERCLKGAEEIQCESQRGSCGLFLLQVSIFTVGLKSRGLCARDARETVPTAAKEDNAARGYRFSHKREFCKGIVLVDPKSMKVDRLMLQRL